MNHSLLTFFFNVCCIKYQIRWVLKIVMGCSNILMFAWCNQGKPWLMEYTGHAISGFTCGRNEDENYKLEHWSNTEGMVRCQTLCGHKSIMKWRDEVGVVNDDFQGNFVSLVELPWGRLVKRVKTLLKYFWYQLGIISVEASSPSYMFLEADGLLYCSSEWSSHSILVFEIITITFPTCISGFQDVFSLQGFNKFCAHTTCQWPWYRWFDPGSVL
jgi:hypothetical protein